MSAFEFKETEKQAAQNATWFEAVASCNGLGHPSNRVRSLIPRQRFKVGARGSSVRGRRPCAFSKASQSACASPGGTPGRLSGCTTVLASQAFLDPDKGTSSRPWFCSCCHDIRQDQLSEDRDSPQPCTRAHTFDVDHCGPHQNQGFRIFPVSSASEALTSATAESLERSDK